MPSQSPQHTQNLQLIQSISINRFGILVSEKRAHRLLTHQLNLWSIRLKEPIHSILKRVQTSPDDSPIVKEFVSHITIGESYFFRHREQLEALVSWIKHNVGHPVRIWSAACSIGCEVYSLAYLLKQAGIEYHILGTDIDRTRLHIARSLGPYGKYSIRGTEQGPASLMTFEDGAYTIQPSWSYNIHFEYHNLQSTQCPTPKVSYANNQNWDVIICRNAFIYFTQEQTRRILQRMSSVLAPDGSIWLSVNDALFDTNAILHPHKWNGHNFLHKHLVQPTLTTLNHPTLKPSLQIGSKAPYSSPSNGNKSTVSIELLQKCLKNGYGNTAKDMLEELQVANPNSLQLKLTQAVLYGQQHHVHAALKLLRQLLKRHPDSEEIPYLMGLFHFTNHNYEAAKICFQQLCSVNPNHWSAKIYLGTILIKERRWLQAEICFEEAKHLLNAPSIVQFSSLITPQGFHEDPQEAERYVDSQLMRLT